MSQSLAIKADGTNTFSPTFGASGSSFFANKTVAAAGCPFSGQMNGATAQQIRSYVSRSETVRAAVAQPDDIERLHAKEGISLADPNAGVDK